MIAEKAISQPDGVAIVRTSSVSDLDADSPPPRQTNENEINLDDVSKQIPMKYKCFAFACLCILPFGQLEPSPVPLLLRIPYARTFKY